MYVGDHLYKRCSTVHYLELIHSISWKNSNKLRKDFFVKEDLSQKRNSHSPFQGFFNKNTSLFTHNAQERIDSIPSGIQQQCPSIYSKENFQNTYSNSCHPLLCSI